MILSTDVKGNKFQRVCKGQHCVSRQHFQLFLLDIVLSSVSTLFIIPFGWRVRRSTHTRYQVSIQSAFAMIAGTNVS